MLEYARKRDFDRTPEPLPAVRSGQGELTFVVHKHAASRLHYDLRLEVDGVLKSWALPHGPSLDPAVKRLAVMVEDHPLDYAYFEGVIPAGQYGAGQVIVWDKGTYLAIPDNQSYPADRTAAETIMRHGLSTGKIKLVLRGEKLKGGFALAKMARGMNNWLIIKHRDEYASTGEILHQELSVLSGLTVADLKAGRIPIPRNAHTDEPQLTTDPANKAGSVPGAHLAPFPSSISPMLATLVPRPFSDPRWLFEPKLDGYRTIALIRNGQAQLFSRRGLNVTGHYGHIINGLSQQPVQSAVLDGEVIATDERGRVCFQCLQNYLNALNETKSWGEPPPIIFYVFDLLYLDGYNLTTVPLIERKRLLTAIFKETAQVRTVAYFTGDGQIIYDSAVHNGLEGIMAKRQDSLYEQGRRSRLWLKVKATLSDEFVIGGFSQGTGYRRDTFSALLLGQYDENGRLVYAGRAGTGFDDKLVQQIYQRLAITQTEECPFANRPPLKAPTTWVQPVLVAEIKFAERTSHGILRSPVFLRLREDKITVPEYPAVTATTRNDTATHREIHSSQDDITPVLEQLSRQLDKMTLTISGYKLALNNLGKTLWPATGQQPALTKRDLLVYLVRVSPYLLPHLRDFPLTLSRYPDGINGERFYQKHYGHSLPNFVTKVPITTQDERTREYMVCNNLATLLWLGQIANIELHTWFSRIAALPDPLETEDISTNALVRFPDFLIFDLDPYIYSGREQGGAEPELNRQAFDQVGETALWLKEILDRLSLPSFIKTSGKTGLHVYVPIKRQLTFEAVRAAAGTICLHINQAHSQETTLEWAVEKRTGKVFLDYNQNMFGKTLASVYSPRPNAEATVSMPLQWQEIGKVYPTDFTIATAPRRLEQVGDLWAGILGKKIDLKQLLGNQIP